MTTEKILFITSPQSPVEKWHRLADSAGIQSRLISVTSAADLRKESLTEFTHVVEWLSVKDTLKKSVLQMLEELVSAQAVILSSAHEGMATMTASWLKYPERLVGFSPMGLYRDTTYVCLSKTIQQAAWSGEKAEALFKTLNLTPLWIKDTPGMVLPRIYAMIANEAAFVLQENVATAKDIDTAMRLGTNYPMGPLAWADQVGVDVVLGILENLWTTYKDERYRPCLLLTKMVTAGHTGVTAGKGFYEYPEALTGAASESSPREQVKSLS
jgi:3-hydroxybutyryl-CoA dehydrogenase